MADLQVHICNDMQVDTISRVDRPKEAYIDMKIVEDSCIRIIVKHQGENLGSISFNRETDFSSCEIEQQQWITLFDEVDDDVYDGDVGVDDPDEPPRALVIFKLVDGF